MWAWARGSWAGTAALSAAVALTAYVALVVLGRTPDFVPWLRYAVYAGAVLAVIGLAMRRQGLLGRRALAAVVKPEEADEDDETDGEVLDEEELVNDSEEIVSEGPAEDTPALDRR